MRDIVRILNLRNRLIILSSGFAFDIFAALRRTIHYWKVKNELRFFGSYKDRDYG